MTKPDLAQLFREMTAPQTLSARALIDSDTAVRAAAGRVIPHERGDVVAALAGSAAHADLVQFLRALEPSSAELAQSLAHQAVTHESRERHPRKAHGRRTREPGWQWGAMAAGIVAAVALFAARTGQPPGAEFQSALAQLSAPAVHTDGIFGEAMDVNVAQQTTAGDEIFRPVLSADDQGDRIFSSQSDS